MGKITPSLSLILLQTLLTKILPSLAQPSLSQYMQLASLGPNASPIASAPLGPPASYPSSPGYGPPPSYQASYQNPPNYQSPQRPTPSLPNPSLPMPLSAIGNLAASIPASNPSLQKAPAVPKPSEGLQSSGLDSNVLNNLAIALQLLIVSNILNMPAAENTPEPLSRLESLKFETMPKYETIPISPVTLSYPVQSPVSLQHSFPYLESPIPKTLYSFESPNLPNSNFLGSSGFIEPTMFGSPVNSGRPNPRSSMALMSPYEALGPNSPFSDPILSSVYSPSYSKKDFQSPYASILAAEGHRDLFSMTDLF